MSCNCQYSTDTLTYLKTHERWTWLLYNIVNGNHTEKKQHFQKLLKIKYFWQNVSDKSTIHSEIVCICLSKNWMFPREIS